MSFHINRLFPTRLTNETTDLHLRTLFIEKSEDNYDQNVQILSYKDESIIKFTPSLTSEMVLDFQEPPNRTL